MKGVLFSFILIVTVFSIMTYVFIQRGLVYTNAERLAVGTRVNSMLNFYNSILYDGGKALDIISKRAVSSATNYVVTAGVGLQSANGTIKELIVNGTINGTAQPLMQSSTIMDWVDKMVDVGVNEGFGVSISLTNLQVKPYDNWNIMVSMDVYANVSDDRGVANITKNSTVNQLVNIENFEDPTYPLYTFARARNIITRSAYVGNYSTKLISASGGNNWFRGMAVVFPSSQNASISAVAGKGSKVLVTDNTSGMESLANQFGAVVSQSSAISGITVTYVYNASNAMSIIPNDTNVLADGSNGAVWYIENIVTDSINSYYHPSSVGGSILDRLEGMLTAQSKYTSQSNNTIGIESFVNKTILSSLGLPVDNSRSNVDYIYFSGGTYATYQVKGMDSTFRIDKQVDLNNNTHDVVYNVSGILV